MARKSRRQVASRGDKTEKNMDSKHRKRYLADGYVRLSREEAQAGGSLQNQRKILEEYVKGQSDMVLYRIWEDNGSSGTNFNRRGFEGMLSDIENEGVNCVIVKDLSRFGRNYLETGMYMERRFPVLNVRLVAVCDHYDSLETAVGRDTLSAFQNLLNENFASDISEKVRRAKRIRMKEGAYLGTLPPYGYRKADFRLVPDPVAAPVVRRIYRSYIQGMTLAQLAGELEWDGIAAPARYFYEAGLLHKERYAQVFRWRSATLHRILSGEVYLGHTVQGKYYSAAIRDSTHARVPEQDWIIVRDTHEAIIAQEEFIKARQRIEAGRKGGR